MKLTITVMVLALWLSGCQPNSGKTFRGGDGAIINALPPDARNVVIKGNGWATFEMDGHKFLFRRTTWDRSATDCITVLP